MENSYRPNLNNESNKMLKAFNISYWISFGVLLLFLVFVIALIFCNGFFSSLLILIISLMPLLLFYVAFIVSLILGVICCIDNKFGTNRKNIIIKLIIIFILSMVFQALPIVVPNIISSYNKGMVSKEFKKVVEKIKDEEDNKYVYFLDDLKEMDSNLKDSKYINSSYITYYNDDIYICLSDGKRTIKGDINNLISSEINFFNSDCTYTFSEEEAKIYLKDYLEEKYNIKILDIKTVIDSGLFSTRIDHYNIVTESVEFGAMAQVINEDEILVTDDYKESIENMNNKNKVYDAVENYTLEYLKVDTLTQRDYIYDIHLYDSDTPFLEIKTNYDKQDASKYVEGLSKHLLTLGIDARVKVVKYITDINTEYQFVITIKEGKITIEER